MTISAIPPRIISVAISFSSIVIVLPHQKLELDSVHHDAQELERPELRMLGLRERVVNEGRDVAQVDAWRLLDDIDLDEHQIASFST
jgi:hypothetical protein